MLVPPLRSIVRELDPALPLSELRTLDDWLSDTVAQPRLTTLLGGVFAGTALLLAAIGIYGVVAYSVRQRTQEIGLRMALGATRAQALSLVLRGGLKWSLIGLVPGLLGAFVAGRGLSNVLFEVRPNDPTAFASAAVLLVSTALVACYASARRAARVDPLVALRCE